MPISKQEHTERRSRLARALEAAGLAGAVIVSRGGATLDRYGDVMYLTGHYQSYSYLPDWPGLFSGRAHTALVLGADGRSTLCLSAPEYDEDKVDAGDIRCTEDFIATIAGAIGDLQLDQGNIGFIGADVLLIHYWRLLAARTRCEAWRPCDELLAQLRAVKSGAELAIVREAAAVHRRAMTLTLNSIDAGRTEAEIAAILSGAITAEGCTTYFTSISSGQITGRWASDSLPGYSRRRLKAGDLFRMDSAIVHQGYLSDFGRSVVVGTPSDRQQRLLDVVHAGLDAFIAGVRPGLAVRDVAAAADAGLRAAGVVSDFSTADAITSRFPVHWGHGLGLGWERPWLTASETMMLQPGMVLAVERALSMAGVGTAAAEQNLVVTDTGAEVLTETQDHRWH